jgi:hypothetical protein
MKSKNKLVCYDIVDDCYLMDTLCTQFTKDISKAKDFSWMGIFKDLYAFTLNKKFPQSLFTWRKALHVSDWTISVNSCLFK